MHRNIRQAIVGRDAPSFGVARRAGSAPYKPYLTIGAIMLLATGWGWAATNAKDSSPMTKQPEVADVLGVTHVIGRYALTEKDFLNEGADQILALGSRVIKLWFYPGQGEPPQKMYPFHSDWPVVTNLVGCAQTPYYRAVFAKPFTTILLTTARPDRQQGYWRDGFTTADEAEETRQFYELAKHFLTTYRDTGKTFVLQHWEGDWLVRGHTDAKRDPEPQKLDNMVRWLNARQAGVTQARQECGERGVKVYHAAEVNRVHDAVAAGRPTVTNRVLPRTKVDLVSYSAYDTSNDLRDDPQAFRAALDFIAKHAPGGKASVYVGEFGCPENDNSPAVVEKTITATVQTALDWGCRYIVYWELYCNELKDPKTPVPVKKNELMRGFWLIRPDGSKSWVWEYFHALLKKPSAQPLRSGVNTNRTSVGAIRWDAWHGEQGVPGQAVQQALSPARWHDRLPFFAKVTGTNQVVIDGTAQSVMDQEIAYAKNAGLDYWAFVTYAENDAMSLGLKSYLNSAHRGDLKFCLLTECNRWRDAAFVTRLVALVQEPGYQTVLDGRPLVYLGFIDVAKFPAGAAGLREVVDDFRARVVAAGQKNPYIVIMDFKPATGQKWLETLGGDALSSYATSGGGQGSYAELAGVAEKFWNDCRATGSPVVPIVMAGWDRRPRIEFPMPWEKWQRPGVGLNYFFETPKPAELARHLDRAVEWSKTNAAPAIIIYAWNENDEGGWIVPTLSEGDARLRAIAKVLADRK